MSQNNAAPAGQSPRRGAHLLPHLRLTVDWRVSPSCEEREPVEDAAVVGGLTASKIRTANGHWWRALPARMASAHTRSSTVGPNVGDSMCPRVSPSGCSKRAIRVLA